MAKKVCPVCKIVFKTKHIRKSINGTYRCPNIKDKCNAILPTEWFEKTQGKRIKDKAMSNEPFIRITWEEAVLELTKALNQKYNVDGNLTFKKDCNPEPAGNMYEFPDFVDIHLEKKELNNEKVYR